MADMSFKELCDLTGLRATCRWLLGIDAGPYADGELRNRKGSAVEEHHLVAHYGLTLDGYSRSLRVRPALADRL